MQNKKREPAIVVIPYKNWTTFNLNLISLDLVEWPLRPTQ